MAMPIYKIEDLQYLQIGMQGENDALQIGIDMSSWVDELADRYPNLQFHLLFKPYGQTTPMPMVTSYDADTKVLTWDISLSATYIQGLGYSEARALNFPDNGLLKKSRSIPTLVENSVSGIEGGMVPAPYDDWVNLVLSTKDELNNILGNPVVGYQNSDNGSVVPTGEWTDTPYPEKGQYMWTRINYNWSTGATGSVYTVTYVGVDGEGVVTTVNGLDGAVVLDGRNVMVDTTLEVQESLKAAIQRLEEILGIHGTKLAALAADDATMAGAISSLQSAMRTAQVSIGTLTTGLATKLDASKIVYSSNQPSNPTPGMLWLKPKT